MAAKQQFNVYLTPGTVARMKHRAIDVQKSLSDLVEEVMVAYLGGSAGATDAGEGDQGAPDRGDRAQGGGDLALQPMLHVEDMGRALDFFGALGASVAHGSRDGDWALLRIGGAELGLLAHPANPEQDEGKVELNFASAVPLEGLEARLRAAGVTIRRPTGDEGFGYQLQVEGPDGMLVKINQLDPSLYQ